MKSVIFGTALAATIAFGGAASAESAAAFYKGKTVQIGYGLGGTYGKSATIMGEHLKPRIVDCLL